MAKNTMQQNVSSMRGIGTRSVRVEGENANH